MSKDNKTLLKDVRELLKQKQFAVAIEKCNQLLEYDANNATIYLFLGAAYQSTDKTQAAKHLRKALELSPTSASSIAVSALQGLATCVPTVELPEIFQQLLQLCPEKYDDFQLKIYNLADKISLLPQCFELLRIEAETAQGERKISALKYLGKLWLTQSCLSVDAAPEKHCDLYHQAMQQIFADNSAGQLHLLAFKFYTQFLYKQQDWRNCLTTARTTIDIYPNENISYEYICRVYCDNYEKPDIEVIMSALDKDIEHYADVLIQLNDNSGLAYLVKAIICYTKEKQFLLARDYTYKMLMMQSNHPIALKLLALIHMELEAYEYALRFWQQLNMPSNKAYAICLSHLQNEEKLEIAVQLLQQLEHADEQTTTALARCYHKLQQLDKLQELQLCDLARAEFLMTTQEALTYLLSIAEEHENNFAAFLLLGKLQMQLGNYAEAWPSLKQAAVLKPHSSQCFCLLAKMYEHMHDLPRAQKALCKCLSLNPVCKDAIYRLSNIYYNSKAQEANINLLCNSLQHMQLERCEKLHYLLSMQYLQMHKYDKAVKSIREALSYDANCLLYWEVLGDALSERGSYQSAIKIFMKILEKDANHTMAKLKIALLKLTTRNYEEAIEYFEYLLQENANCVAAHKGAAEAHIGLAEHLRLEYRFGRCKEHLQLALEHAQEAFLLLHNYKMVWPWQLFVQIFMQTASLPYSLANLQVSSKLTHQDTHCNNAVELNRADLCKYSIKFLICAIKLQRDNSHLWYDLASAFYYSAMYNSQDAMTNLKSAFSACRMALKISNNWQNWNLLGVICMHKEINKLQLAQHCFIKAVSLEHKSYRTWTNLGALYLLLSETKLANLSFQRAQQSNPIFCNCWVGQAMVAEALGEQEEALDLFRHCQQFEYHAEAALGYAHWVCLVLSNETLYELPHHKHAINNMYANTVALDAINRYVSTEQTSASVAGLTFQGFLNAQANLCRPALKSYLLALSKTTADDSARNDIITSIGYLYIKINEPEKAIESFNSVTETTFTAMIGLALAYAQSGDSQNAYLTYQAIITCIGQDDERAGKIYVAMAAMLFSSEQHDDAKNMLLNCILHQNATVEAVYSAFALGILTQNFAILDTILIALKQFENNVKYCAQMAYLQAQFFVLKKEPENALRYIQTNLHIFPQCLKLRQVCAAFLLKHFNDDAKYQLATSQMALGSVIKMHPKIKQKGGSIADSNALLVASRAMQPIDKIKSMALAQKAIHLYPENLKSWNFLL